MSSTFTRRASTPLTVRPIDDGLDEADELVVVQLNPNAAYTLGPSVGAGVVIADNDAPGVEVLPVLIVVANRDFYYQEYHDPRIELEARGIPVVVGAGRREFSMPHLSSGQGDFHGNLIPDVSLAEVDPTDYSAIVFVGGWGVSEYQYAFPGTYTNTQYNGTPETRERVNELINGFVALDKYVAGVCHGVSALAWARIDGQSPLQGRTVTTAVFNSPANNVPGAVMYRWHSEVNGATVLEGGSIGDPTTDADDVWIDGQFITAQNNRAARLFGQTLASRLLVTL